MTPALSAKQLRSIRESTARVNIWEGAVRSGKTIASLLRFVMALSVLTGAGEIVIISRTRDSAARNVFAPLQDRNLFGAVAETVHYSPGSPHGWILGRKVWVLGSSDRKAENVLRGLTCSLAYVDEVTLLSVEFWQQLLNRLWIGAQLFGTTNPDSPAHWLKSRFLDRIDELPDWRTWRFGLNDNPLLTEERKAAIRRENTGMFYQRNVLGRWVAGQGAVYDGWDPKRHVLQFDDLPDMDRLLSVGIDYGTTNATAALMLGIGPNVLHPGRSALYLLDEWRHDAKADTERLTDQMLSDRIRAWLLQKHHPTQRDLPVPPVIVDPSAASFRQQLHVDRVSTTPADNDVMYGIRTVASLIGSDSLFSTTRTPGWNREAPGYSWDEEATKKGEDKPVKVADHSLDGGRYAVVTTEALWRSRLALAA